MMRISKSLVNAFLGFSFVLARIAAADDPSEKCPTVYSQKPASTDAPIDPELEKVLEAWQQAVAKIKRFDSRFTSHQFDHVFEVEFRGEGSMSADRDGRAEYHLDPATIPPESVSNAKNRGGKPYAVKPGRAVSMVWTDGPKVKFNGEDWSTSGYLAAPREFWLARPFLLGMPIEELRNTFDVKLYKQSADRVSISLDLRSYPTELFKAAPHYKSATESNRLDATRIADFLQSRTFQDDLRLRRSKGDSRRGR
jgi:hypothetical protein